jgi:hypothetical protein
MADKKCQCLTKVGSQCRNSPMKNTKYCYAHRKCGSSSATATKTSDKTLQFLELSGLPMEQICQELIDKQDFKSLSRLISTNSHVKRTCQPLLDDAKSKQKFKVQLWYSGHKTTVEISRSDTTADVIEKVTHVIPYPVSSASLRISNTNIKKEDKFPLKKAINEGIFVMPYAGPHIIRRIIRP